MGAPIAISSTTKEGLDPAARAFEDGGPRCSWSLRRRQELPANGRSILPGLLASRLQKGRHTTRHVELHPVRSPVADTPGFNRPDLPKQVHNLEVLFPELRRQLEPHPAAFVIACWEEPAAAYVTGSVMALTRCR